MSYLQTIRVDELKRGDLIHFPNTIVRRVDSVHHAKGRRFVTIHLDDDGVLTLRANTNLRIEED